MEPIGGSPSLVSGIVGGAPLGTLTLHEALAEPDWRDTVNL
jgi:hypothetical protein